MKIIRIIINSIFLLVMLAVAGLFLAPYLPIENNIELRIVESGSMEPAIMTGSLVVVRPLPTYQIGDVITFESRNAEVPTTHRVVDSYQEAGRTWFLTKGDANEEADTTPVMAKDILGVVALSVPRAGFVFDFARQPMGFIFLIVLPALLIVLLEVEKIWREIRRRKGPVGYRVPARDRQPRDHKVPIPATKQVTNGLKKRKALMMDIGTPAHTKEIPTLDLRKLAPYKVVIRPKNNLSLFNRATATMSVLLFSMLVASSGFMGSTVSYFNDFEVSIDNFLGAISLNVSAVPDGEVYNFTGSEIDDPDGSVVVFVTPEDDSAPVHYEVLTNVTSSSTVLCDAIEADADAPVNYSGPLPSLSATDIVFAAPWSVAFALPDESSLLGGETCEAEIVLTAWHFDVNQGEGYFDEEIIPLTFTYTAPVLFVPFAAFSLPAAPTLSVSSPTPVTESETKPIVAGDSTSNKPVGDSETDKPEASETKADDKKVEEIVEPDEETESVEEEEAEEEKIEEPKESEDDTKEVEGVEKIEEETQEEVENKEIEGPKKETDDEEGQALNP